MLRRLLSHTSAVGLAGSTSYTRRSSERAEEVLSLLKERVALEGKVILDLGCGVAPLSESFQRISTFLVGLDVNERYVREAQRNTSLELVLGDAKRIPFKNDSFDFILCNDVLEHVRDEAELMREVLRVLACNGAAYIQCANRYQIIEPHFLLPFLSWIPRTLANIYVRIAGKGKNYEGYYPKTRRGILALTKVHRTVDLTYERTYAKIESLNIRSKVLRQVVSVARIILSDRYIAAVAQNFSIISILVFKD